MSKQTFKGEPLHIPNEPGLVDEDGKKITTPEPRPISAFTDDKLRASAKPGSPIPVAPPGEKVASSGGATEFIPVATDDNPTPESVEVPS